MVQFGEYYLDRFVTLALIDIKTNTILAASKNISEGSIETTAESKEVKDAQGNLIQKIYTGKSGTFTFTSALMNANVQALTAGSKLKSMAGKTITLTREVPTGTAKVTLKGAKEGTISLVGLSGSSAVVKTYSLDSAAGADKGSYVAASNELTLPTGKQEGVVTYLICYQATLDTAIGYDNNAKEFPSTCKLVTTATVYETCDSVEGRLATIEIPNAKLSPETTLALKTDSTLDIKGDIQVDYCSADKKLYSVYFLDENDE